MAASEQPERQNANTVHGKVVRVHMSCGVCSWTGDIPERPAPYIAWCPTCSTGLTVPPPRRDIATDGVFTAPTSYQDRLASREQWTLEAQARVTWLSQHVPPGAAVLEIGSATGEFVHAAETAGFETLGVEPSVWASDQARQLTSCIFTGDLADYRKQNPGRHFDAGVMFHTLEHVTRPRPLLQELTQVLRPGGVLLVEVPNAGTQALASDGNSWWMSSLADHVHHFRPGGLERLLSDSGYETDVGEVTLRSAYGGDAPSFRVRARALVRHKRWRESRDLLRAVARERTG